MSESFERSEFYPGALVGPGVEFGADLRVGQNVVVHAGTVVGDGCELQDGVVLGKSPRLGKYSTAQSDPLDTLVIGTGAVICAGSVVCAGSRIGPATIVGDQTQIRERTVIGAESVIGRGVAVENEVLVGDRVKVQSNCYLTAYTTVENDVFIAPGVVTTNDNTMGRHGDSYELRGAVFRRACRVGGGAVLLPGVEIGAEAFVGAGAVVTENVPGRAVVVGVPARQIREVTDEDLIESWR